MAKTYLPKDDSPVQTLDARGQVLGRLASRVATILRGKHSLTFAPHRIEGQRVNVINAKHIHLTGNKLNQKKYYHHTGYLGNLKEMTLVNLMAHDPSEVIRRAVYGMLPANRLRSELMKRLTIYKEEEL